jgi:chemotaxis protein methyltransferase CheR
MNLSLFQSLIKQRTGLAFNDHRSAKLTNAIRGAMARKNIKSEAEYYNLLLLSKSDFAGLVNQLTINETYFFREPLQLNILTKYLVPDLLKKKGTGTRIKILSAGCSTGEEPYSLALALLEHLGPGIKANLQVIGVDIDTEAIRRARQALYGKLSFRSLSPQLKDKYFDSSAGSQYQIKDFVREMVDFHFFNLTNQAPPATLGGLDVIFYRNVAIYFERDTQKEILRNLSRLLNQGGYLFTSATETLSHDFGLLTLIEIDGVFLYQRQPEGSNQKFGAGPGRTIMPPTPSNLFFTPPPGLLPFKEEEKKKEDQKPPQPQSFAELFAGAQRLIKAKQYPEALAGLKALLRHDPSHLRAFVLKANVLFNLDQLEEAQCACRRALDLDPLHLEGYLLLGLIARRQGDQENSRQRFKEALYIDPSCWLAHFFLAEIYQDSAEYQKARREYEIILNLSSRQELSDLGLDFFTLSVPLEQMTQLCRYKLAHLEGFPGLRK